MGNNLEKEIMASIKEFIGTLGIAKASPKFIEIKKEFAILCINRKSLDYVKASFAMWPEKINVERVSGTLKGLKKKR